MLKLLPKFLRPRRHPAPKSTQQTQLPLTADPKLPEELLLKVLGYADIVDLVTASQVCRIWKYVASSLQFTLPLLQPLVPNMILSEHDDLATLQLLSSQRRIQCNRKMGRYSVTELPINVGNMFRISLWFTDDNRYAVALAETDTGLWVFTVVDMKTRQVALTRGLDTENVGLFDPHAKVYFGEDGNRLIRIDLNTLNVEYEPFPFIPHGLYCWKLVFNDAGQLIVEDNYDGNSEKNVYSPDGMVQYHWSIMHKCQPTAIRVTGACNIKHQAESCFALAVSPDNRYVLISGYTKALLLNFDPQNGEKISAQGVYPGTFIPIKYHRRQWGSCWDS